MDRSKRAAPGKMPPATPPPAVVASDTVAQAVRTILTLHLGRLRAHEEGARRGEDPERLHDMRVATRRLRAAIRVFGEGIPLRLRRHLTVELRWLGRLLGGVRDLDVQLARLDRYRVRAAPVRREALSLFRAAIEAEREPERAKLLAGLDSQRYQQLVADLERFTTSTPPRLAHAPAAAETIALAGRQAIKAAYRRVTKSGRGIGSAPRPEELHVLRIRAKRLRYVLEFLRDIIGKPGRRLIKQLVRLQDLLGAHQDSIVGEAFVRKHAVMPSLRTAPGVAEALEQLIGVELRRARQSRAQFRQTWKRFNGKPARDDLETVLRTLKRSA